MISELAKSDFHKCRCLINEHGNMEVKAIIEGNNPGRIFVDDGDSPTSGLIWQGNNDGFLFIGDEQNQRFNKELNTFIDEVIAKEAEKLKLTWFEGVGSHPKWNKTIEEVFNHRKLGSWNQKVYKLQKDDYKSENEPIIEDHYKVIKLTQKMYDNYDFTNIDFLHSKILALWSSPEEFFRNGMGYGSVFKNQIVSLCLTAFVADNVHCIDIETLEAHQGKKLAQKVAHSFVKECLENGLIPYWDCMESNKPSVAVAESIGFKNEFNYKGYEFPFH